MKQIDKQILAVMKDSPPNPEEVKAGFAVRYIPNVGMKVVKV